MDVWCCYELKVGVVVEVEFYVEWCYVDCFYLVICVMVVCVVGEIYFDLDVVFGD